LLRALALDASDKRRTDVTAGKPESTPAVPKHPAPGREVYKPRVSAARQSNDLAATAAGCGGEGTE